MRTVIVDTNILFSALLGKSQKLRDAILTEKEVAFYSCKFVFVELFKYKEKIQKKSSLDEDEILELLYSLLKKIKIFDAWNLLDALMVSFQRVNIGVVDSGVDTKHPQRRY